MTYGVRKACFSYVCYRFAAGYFLLATSYFLLYKLRFIKGRFPDGITKKGGACLNYLVYGMIAVGAVLMVFNVVSFLIFMKSTRDVISGNQRHDKRWMRIAFVLLTFFLLGYIYVAVFGQPDLMVAMILFGGSVFVSIVNYLMAKLLETAKERSIDVAEIIVGAIDARDPNLNGHSRHVQNLTMKLYYAIPKAMRGDINAVSLEYASVLHDVGKLGIPESILNKPAKLTEEEWRIMRMHPKIGVDILRPLRSFAEIAPWILYHHERMDGKGYYRKSADEIPLAARMIAVADTYSAITMRRSYKEPRTHEEAAAIIREAAGTQLDAQLAEIFLSIPREELLACAPPVIEIGSAPENRGS